MIGRISNHLSCLSGGRQQPQSQTDITSIEAELASHKTTAVSCNYETTNTAALLSAARISTSEIKLISRLVSVKIQEALLNKHISSCQTLGIFSFTGTQRSIYHGGEI